MFDRRELSSLISGEARALNIEDLRAHTQYAGGYSDEHRVIKTFWDVLAGFNREQQAKFLQFVTSCPKPPLLGMRAWGPGRGYHGAPEQCAAQRIDSHRSTPKHAPTQCGIVP